MSAVIYAIVLCLCNPDIPQTSLHKHETAQNTADTPRISLHIHGTITQNTADTPQTSLHKLFM
jgi:hypothetical protein